VTVRSFLRKHQCDHLPYAGAALKLNKAARHAWERKHRCPHTKDWCLGSGSLCTNHAIEHLIRHPGDMRVQDTTAILSILLARVEHLEQQVDTLRHSLPQRCLEKLT
jgi:hypothetical protein